jgi:serine/threonine-protein kinase
VDFRPGTVLAGKYRIERVIGEGGMGVVLAARHLGLDEMVAVKLIRAEGTAGAEALARFRREARAAARIKSEHVARVLDVDRLPSGAPYIVMELIEGTDLDALLKKRGPLLHDEAVTYILQACEGVAEAHALGMVHRDLKLKNLFATQRRDGRMLVKVIDFGIVKLARVSEDTDTTLRLGAIDHAPLVDATLTRSSSLVGSVHYMAPEQIRASKEVDARADVWSLGVCLYMLLTGELPFQGETLMSVCAAIQGRHPRDVRELVPSVPEGLGRAVMHALEKDLGRRFANVGAFAAALAPFGRDPSAAQRIESILGPSTSEIAPRKGNLVSPATMPAGRIEGTLDAQVAVPMSEAPSRRGRSMLLGGVLLVAAAGGMLIVLDRSRLVPASPEAPAASPTPPPPEPSAAAPPPVPPPTTTLPAISPATSAPVVSSAPRPSPLPPSKRAPTRAVKTGAAPSPPTSSEPASPYDRF